METVTFKDLLTGKEVNYKDLPVGLSRKIAASFVKYNLNKEKCPKLLLTPGVNELEKAMKAYTLAFKRYRYMINNGIL